MFGMGGKRAPSPSTAGAPRAAKEKKPARVRVTVDLEPRQRDKLALLGGDAWLREQIDAAKIPNVFAAGE